MFKLIYNLNKWFEWYLGWFFVSPRKQDQWHEYLKKKYKKDQKQ